MPENKHNSVAETIQKIAALEGPQTVVYRAEEGDLFQFDFPLGMTQFAIDEGDLVVSFESGGNIILQDFMELANAGNPPKLAIYDGAPAYPGGVELLTLLNDPVEPAAPAMPSGGGSGEYQDDFGQTIDGVDRLDPLSNQFLGRTDESVEEATSSGGVYSDNQVSAPAAAEDLTGSSSGETVYAVLSGAADVTEGASATYTVRLVDDQGNPVDVSEPTAVTVTLTSGTAESGDYAATPVTVTIQPGSSSVSVEVATYSDIDFDDETFIAAVTDVEDTGEFVAIEVGSDNSVTTTIVDADTVPVATDDSYSTTEDTALTLSPSVLANDSDLDGDSLSVSSYEQPTNGTVTTDVNGNLVYTPDANFNGEDSFTYSVSDGNGGTDTATVTITVGPVNDAPVAADDTVNATEDTPATYSLADLVDPNDSDLDGDTLTISAVGNPSNGTVVLNADGSVTFAPDDNYTGTATFEYTVSDGNGGTDTATVTVNVGAVNDAPVAADDSYSTDEDTALTLSPGVLGNDTDLDGDSLSVASYDQPANGTVTSDANGNLVYTPDANFNGEDSFTYTVSDGNGGTDTATVTVNVGAVNDAPVAEDDSYTTSEDTALTLAPSVLANDSDLDGDSLSVESYEQPANGTVTSDANGNLVYTPDANFNGEDSFTYTVSDGNGVTDTATVTVNVGAVNDAPVADDDSYSTTEDTVLTLAPSVLANDTDLDGDSLGVSSYEQPTNGTVTTDVDGNLVYTPNANFNGEDSFTYTISDGNGGTDTATVTITVAPVNDAPVAEDDSYSTTEDTALTLAPSVLANDTDLDGDSLSVSSFEQPANGTVSTDANGNLVYTPDANFNGEDSFTCTVSDGNGGTDTATVTVNVGAVNDAPVTEDDSYTTSEDTALTLDPSVLANDSDLDGDSLSVSSYEQPANGTVSTDANGNLVYTPNANFNGEDSFTYTVSDGNGGTDTATVTITVDPVNDAPVADDDSYTTSEDTALTLDPSILANDTDLDGDSLSVSSYEQPTNGTVTTDVDGNLVYTPDANFNGTDTFTYTVSDGNGGTDTATVTITVDSVNDAPVAEDDSYTTSEDTALTLDPSVLANDTDLDGDSLSVTSYEQPTNGTVTTDANGNLVYTPDANFNGEDSFTYTVSDGTGGTDTATVTVNVGGTNDAPVAEDDSYSTSEDTALTLDPSVLTNDTDLDGDSLSVSSYEQPANGTVTTDANGNLVYTPDANFNGMDTFTYTVSDGNGGTDTATVTVNVGGTNDAPVADDDSYNTSEDTALILDPGVLANDTDLDGDSLSVSSYEQPANGTVTTDVDGNLVYTPDANFNGTDTFTYTVSDGNGGTDTATVTVNVGGANDAPVADDDSYSTAEDTALTLAPSVLANDSDLDGDSLSVSSYEQPANGTVTTDANGNLIYTPDANFNGEDSFTYTVSDGNGGTDTATVTVNVGAVNDAPVADDDSYSTAEDTALTLAPSVLANDSDLDGDGLSVSSYEQPANGTVTTDANGNLVYTPDANFNGEDSFTYTVSDGNGGTDTATVTINVGAVNDAPVADDDSYSTSEDTALILDPSVLANDSDLDGDSLSVTSYKQPTNGTVTTDANGNLIYTPDANFNGEDSFSYTVSDGNGGIDTATVTITVDPVNDAPTAADDSYSTAEDTSLTLAPSMLANDSDLDGDSLSVSSYEQPANGTVTTDANGNLVYTPDANFNGEDTFTYTVSDGNGGTDTATVTVNVGAVNDAPVADDDSYTTSEDTALTLAPSVLANDTDLDGDSLSISSYEQPANGTVTTDANGNLVYTPNANYNGEDSFTYTVSDGNGGTDTATVTVNVGGTNDAPVAEDDSYSTTEDTALTLSPSVLANDTDLDGDSLSVSSYEQPANGTVSTDANGNLVYTPNANFNGEDSFTYTVSDGNGGTDTATVTVNVGAENDAPVADDDRYSTSEDTALILDPSVLANDSDLDGDSLSVASYDQPANGMVSTDANGNLVYTPDANFNGEDSFTYTVSDGNGGIDTATVTITVDPVNDAPTAADDSYSTDEDTALTLSPSVLANDSDLDGDGLSVSSYEQPANGTVTTDANGNLVYTPDANFNGEDSFSYTVSDGNGGTDTATVTVNVGAENDAPVADDDSYTTSEDMALTLDPSVLVNDSDLDGDSLSVTSYEQPANGMVSTDANGNLVYTPDANFNGEDSFSYTVSDGNGGTDTATVTVNVGAENDAPVAEDDSYTTSEDTALTLDPSVLANDSDLDGDSLSISSYEQPANGTVSTDANGNLIYTPDAHFNGEDTFTYTVSEGNGGTDTATVTVNVGAVNDAPVADDDSYSTSEDTALILDPSVLANDSDLDGDSLSVTSYEQPANGSVTTDANGNLVYSPDANFNGEDSFTYTVSDGNGGTDTATVTVNVGAVNDAPVADDDSYTTSEDTALTLAPSVLANDTDLDGDSLSVASYEQPANGTVSTDANGNLVYTPDANFNGEDSFSYTVSDGNGGTDTAAVTITVDPVNDAPTAEDDSYSTAEDTALTLSPSMLANDSDLDGDSLSVFSYEQPANGTVSTDANGNLVYTPNANFNGTDTFTYTVSDGNGGTDTATVTITVAPVNDAPVAEDDSYSTAEDTALTLSPSVLANDSDLDGDSLSVESYEQPANGTVATDANGNLVYTPDVNFNGTDTFNYTVSDGNGGTDTATVTITVDPVNDAPTAADDSYSTAEDTVLTLSPSVLANDTDLDGDSLSVSSFEQPANGTVATDANGNLVYTPDVNFNGTDTFNYTVSDGNGGTDTATVTITVDPVNDAPVAEDDSYSTDEDTALTLAPSVLANDTDLDGDSLSIDSYEQPANGTVTTDANGNLVYIPDANFNGTDTFTYTVSDGNGGTDTATVTITVDPVNDAPVAEDDSYSTAEDTALTLAPSVLANDSDLDGDSLSVSSYEQPANGTVSTDANGSLIYTPDANFNGEDSFTYTVSDGNGGTDTATVTITVDPVNDAPTAADDSYSTAEDTALTLAPSVLANDSDLDGDSLSVESYEQPANGTVTTDANGNLVYTPDANFNGEDSFTYTVSDGNGGTDTATVTVNVGAVNDAPVAEDNSYSADEDTALTLAPSVLANDTDLDGDSLSVSSYEQPANGTVTTDANGNLIYTPDANFNGEDSFTYTVSDGNGGTDTATVTITVDPVNDAPTAADDSYSTDEDTALTLSPAVLANDTDLDGDSLSIDSYKQPANGTVTTDANGNLVYTPNANFNGTDTFTYTVSDGNGGTDTATVTVNVDPVNDAPTTTGGSVITEEDAAYTFTVDDFNFIDVDGDNATLLRIDSLPADGTLFLDGTAVTSGAAISVDDISDGLLTFVPENHDSGSDVYSDAGVGDQQVDYATFEYSVSDGKVFSAGGTMTVDVTPVADAPVLTIDDQIDFGSTGVTATLPVSDGLIMNYYDDVDLATTVAADTNLVEAALEAATPTATTTETSVFNDNDSHDTVETGDAYSYTGLIFLEAGQTLTLSGYIDDTMRVEIGGDTLYDVGFNTWGAYPGTLSGSNSTVGSGSFTALESGYYTVEMFFNNSDSIGAYSVYASIDGADALLLNTENFNLYTGTDVLDTQGAVYLPLVANGDGGYYPVPNAGAEGLPVQLSTISASLVDDDGSEVLASIVISDIREGCTISDGTNSFTATAESSSTDVSGWNLSGLTYVGVDVPEEGAIHTLTVTATSQEIADGVVIDSASTSSSLEIYLSNSEPFVQADEATVYESALPGGTDSDSSAEVVSGNLLANDNIDSGTPISAVSIAGGASVIDGTTVTVTTAEGNQLVVNLETGDYTYSLVNAVAHDSDSFSYTVGDLTSTLDVTIVDDAPAVYNESVALNVNVDTMSIQNLAAGFSEAVFLGGTGSVTTINDDSDSNIDAYYWGDPAVDGGSKSGYSLVDNSAYSSAAGQQVTTGELIVLGEFTHENWPIWNGSSILDSITLNISFDVVVNGVTEQVSFAIAMDHNETPNDSGDPRDIISLPQQSYSFELNGEEYTVNIEGFIDADNPGAGAVTTIYTDESASNHYQLVASISSTDTLPSVSGNVMYEAGADGTDTHVVWDDTSSEYGTLTTHSDGSYEFELSRAGKDGLGDGETLTEQFTYSVTDTDGDTTSATLTIRIAGNSGSELSGTEGSDHLIGSDADDTLSGAAGNDILTGDDGIDIFDFNVADAGATDTITDFTAGQGGDVLDIGDLLEGATTETLSQYLHFESGDFDGDGSADDTLISVDVDGGSVFEASQNIVLRDNDLAAGGTLADQDIINTLLTNHNLTTD